MSKLAVVILAAGAGTRMKSSLPKVLHEIEGKPLISWVLDAVMPLKPHKTFVVVGHGSEKVKESLSRYKIDYILQKKQSGSGHALMQAEAYLKGFTGNVIVLSGDVPLIRAQTLKKLLHAHTRQQATATILSAIVDNPFGYGRIYRERSGNVMGIVEEKDASDQIRKIHEINSGMYCFSSPLLWSVLHAIRPNNKKKEYYVTDAIMILKNRGKKVGAYPVTNNDEILGVNNRVHLSLAHNCIRMQTLNKLMLDGVSIIDPSHTYIAHTVKIKNDTTIFPGTSIGGKTVIGAECRLGPYAIIKDSRIADGVEIINSHVYNSIIDAHAKIGPFAHVRPGTHLRAKAKVGNFSETKNAIVGMGSKVNHLTYIGDSKIGKNVNVGAGTITCNYDGVRKNKTVIGDNTFVGSNVNFIAPVKVGANTLIGAGSTITDNVPSKSLAIARSRQVNKPRKK